MFRSISWLWLICSFAAFSGSYCTSRITSSSTNTPNDTLSIHPDHPATFFPDRIAFGSCNDQDKDQPLWPVISNQDPDLWIWLGDNIYADTRDMSRMTSMYAKQKGLEGYDAFRSGIPIIGIWDDHDYGVNDGDKTYPKKAESKRLMFDFLDIPENSTVYSREGAYMSYDFVSGTDKLKVILLDGRSFRSPLSKEDNTYIQDPEGLLLGESQWDWLSEELQDTTVDIFLIACGIQFIPEEHRYEKWANFPSERQRFFSLLARSQPKAVLLLSGDRHIGEISCIDLPGLPYLLCEITSSGLTHSWKANPGEPNRYRKGQLVRTLNFGTIELYRVKNEKLNIIANIHGPKGEVKSSIELTFD